MNMLIFYTLLFIVAFGLFLKMFEFIDKIKDRRWHRKMRNKNYYKKVNK